MSVPNQATGSVSPVVEETSEQVASEVVPQETTQDEYEDFFSGKLEINAPQLEEGQKTYKGVPSLHQLINNLPEEYRKSIKGVQIMSTKKLQQANQEVKLLKDKLKAYEDDRTQVISNLEKTKIPDDQLITQEQAYEDPEKYLMLFIKQQNKIGYQEMFKPIQEKIQQEQQQQRVSQVQQELDHFISIHPDLLDEEVHPIVRSYTDKGLTLDKAYRLAKMDLEEQEQPQSKYQKEVEDFNSYAERQKTFNKISPGSKRSALPNLVNASYDQINQAVITFRKQNGRAPSTIELNKARGK